MPKAASGIQDVTDGHSFPSTTKQRPPEISEVKQALADALRDLRQVCEHKTSATTALQCFLKRYDLNCVEKFLIVVKSFGAA
jgi:hypothetical protein